jgi:hypothetical protein
MKKNLFDLDLQFFADEVGEEVSEAAEPTEGESEGEVEGEEGEEETGAAEPEPQSAEENARYAAIRRRAEEDARRKYEAQIGSMNQQIAAMCSGITHPVTGQPITNVHDYIDALAIQQRQANEAELQEKGVDPALINRMIETNPVVMQAQQVIEKNNEVMSEVALKRDIEEISKINPNIKDFNDVANLPTFPQMVDYVARYNMSIVDAYKIFNFGSAMQQTNQAARQQAINQMRGKDHLSTQTGVSQAEDYVEVPTEIMNRWKSEGKTEKQIRSLYKTVAGKLHLN